MSISDALIVMAYIWCDDCQAVQPLVVDHLLPGPLNSHAAQDLICGGCRVIVATLHEALGVEVPPAQ